MHQMLQVNEMNQCPSNIHMEGAEEVDGVEEMKDVEMNNWKNH